MFARLKFYCVFAMLTAGFFNAQAQAVFDVSFGQLKFLNANRTTKVGVDGSAAGNVTLYTNVITVSGQQIDCIVRTVSVTGATFGLPGGAPGGTVPFDYSSASGTGMSANQDAYFSPTLNFNSSGGSVKFRFEFILGGSYNNSSNTGAAVILKNIYLNTYDIDGNGGASSNQFNEFGSFSAYTLAAPSTNIGLTYNTSSGLTRFRSNTTANTTNVTADANRVRVKYDYLSSIDIQVGAEGSGAAYFFLDFSGGVAWTGSQINYNTPSLDLDTEVAGIDRTETVCGNAGSLTSGTINYTGSSGAADEVVISFSTPSIPDGNMETFYPKGSTNTSYIIGLGFTGSSTQNIVVSGTTYTVQKNASAGTSTMTFSKTGGGTLTSAQVEALLDGLAYKDTKLNPTQGPRTFSVIVREGPLTSPFADYNVTLDCTSNAILPVSVTSITATAADQGVLVRWTTLTESLNKGFHVERSLDGVTFTRIAFVSSRSNYGNSTSRIDYDLLDTERHQRQYYRLAQEDLNGRLAYSNTILVSLGSANSTAARIFPNPSAGLATLSFYSPFPVHAQWKLTDQAGRTVLRRTVQLGKGVNALMVDISTLQPGVYLLTVTSANGNVMVNSRLIRK